VFVYVLCIVLSVSPGTAFVNMAFGEVCKSRNNFLARSLTSIALIFLLAPTSLTSDQLTKCREVAVEPGTSFFWTGEA